MSEFYGRLRGGRQEITRTGTRGSGISAGVETWKAVLNTRFFYEGHDSDNALARIEIRDKNGNYTGFNLVVEADAIGKCSPFSEMLHPEMEAVAKAIDALNVKAREVAP